MNSTVSVIIPVFNGALFIARAVQSALEQTYPPYEVVVVNDGSVDGTIDELSVFGEKIKVISIQNGGASNARNVGIRASSGEFIAFLDADDIWHREKLMRQMAAFNKDENIGFCCCDYSVLYKHIGRTVNHFSIIECAKDISYDGVLKTDPFEVLIKENFVGTSSNVIIRRSVLDTTGLFNVAYRQAEDYDLWLRCALVTDFVILSACLVEKTSHEGNLTNDFLDTLLCHERVLLAIRADSDAMLRPGIRWQSSQLALAKTRYQIGNLLFETGQESRAFYYYLRGMLTWRSFANLRQFSYYVSRKMVRLISFGLVRNLGTDH
jgi:glycosyltransferase involved in cell wall biosynthesis